MFKLNNNFEKKKDFIKVNFKYFENFINKKVYLPVK